MSCLNRVRGICVVCVRSRRAGLGARLLKQASLGCHSQLGVWGELTKSLYILVSFSRKRVPEHPPRVPERMASESMSKDPTPVCTEPHSSSVINDVMLAVTQSLGKKL